MPVRGTLPGVRDIESDSETSESGRVQPQSVPGQAVDHMQHTDL